jgi:acyl-CoA dehydrogenase
MVQEKIADSWIELEQFRLLVLRTAWLDRQAQGLQEGAQGHLGGSRR